MLGFSRVFVEAASSAPAAAAWLRAARRTAEGGWVQIPVALRDGSGGGKRGI